MNADEFEALLDRVKWVSNQIADQGGTRFEWSAQASTGAEVRYEVCGIKPFQDFQHQTANLLIWTWSLKDYLKSLFKDHGVDAQLVEDAVNTSRELSICADLANRSKHPDPNRSRSGRFPKLGKVGFDIPQNALRSIALAASNEYSIAVEQPELVRYRAPVLDQSGNKIADAIEICTRALDQWRDLVRRHGLEKYLQL